MFYFTLAYMSTYKQLVYESNWPFLFPPTSLLRYFNKKYQLRVLYNVFKTRYKFLITMQKHSLTSPTFSRVLAVTVKNTVFIC